MRRFLIGCCLLLTLIVMLPQESHSCAPVSGKGTLARIYAEKALIIWDAKSQTQHFIRQGNFASNTSHFGFLVPTPSKPELGEVADDLFSTLEDWTKPEEKTVQVTRTLATGYSRTAGPVFATKTAPVIATVEVLAKDRVAGLDAVSLKANDSAALSDWLKKHGYVTNQALDDWLKFYVKHGWVITAFKIASTKSSPTLGTKTLRMSFKTEKPFYPYREPWDARVSIAGWNLPARSLTLYVLADDRVEGTIGEGGPTVPAMKTYWADRINETQRDDVFGKLQLAPGTMPNTPWLTVFEDGSNPRNGVDELYLPKNSSQDTVKPPPTIKEDYVDPPPFSNASGTLPVFAGSATIAALLLMVCIMAMLVWSRR
jgi:hypothetical protein